MKNGHQGRSRRFLGHEEPAQVGEAIGDLQCLGLKPPLCCIDGLELDDLPLHVGELIPRAIRHRTRRSEVLVGPAPLETARGDKPYVLANLARARAIGLQVLVEMNDAGQDLPVFGLYGGAIEAGRLDQQAQGQGDQRCHQSHCQLDDVDGVAAQVMFRKSLSQGHADAGTEQRTEEGQAR